MKLNLQLNMIIEQHGTHITNKAGSFLKFRQKEIGNATW